MRSLPVADRISRNWDSRDRAPHLEETLNMKIATAAATVLVLLMFIGGGLADPLDDRPRVSVVCKRIIAYGETPRLAQRSYDRQKRKFEAEVLARYGRLHHVRTEGGASYFNVPCKGGTELGRAKTFRCKLVLRPCYLRLRQLNFLPAPIKRK